MKIKPFMTKIIHFQVHSLPTADADLLDSRSGHNFPDDRGCHLHFIQHRHRLVSAHRHYPCSHILHCLLDYEAGETGHFYFNKNENSYELKLTKVF